MSKKGPQFERDFCRDLSKWWTGGNRDDVFWRTSNSGGRATGRKKKGKKTFGQDGDIQATDPIGQPLIDNVLFELKNGYTGWSPLDAFMAKPPKGGFVHWIKKVQGEAEDIGVPYWALVWKQRLRKEIIYMPRGMITSLWGGRVFPPHVMSRVVLWFDIIGPIVGMLVSDWMKYFRPDDVDWSRKCRK